MVDYWVLVDNCHFNGGHSFVKFCFMKLFYIVHFFVYQKCYRSSTVKATNSHNLSPRIDSRIFQFFIMTKRKRRDFNTRLNYIRDRRSVTKRNLCYTSSTTSSQRCLSQEVLGPGLWLPVAPTSQALVLGRRAPENIPRQSQTEIYER